MNNLSQNNYVDEYRKNAVMSATPLQLIVMLYDGSLRFLDLGIKAMKSKKYYEQNENFQKAQKIIVELISSLNEEAGGEIASNLKNIYVFIYDSLVKSNLEDDVELALKCRKIIADLRGAWYDVEKKQKKSDVKDNKDKINA